ncbi:hypothetical protein G7Y89_g12422 [Cudoniella acicularis]|uniref:alpha-1,2-Mannosidase n=1 Tax=Cudoniella acicularis TaxID=354080 RepID=A0A8H4RAG3_9HELO|nr:hypothetical protein G7Y89_g12422 [Cudoniella acicularis]
MQVNSEAYQYAFNAYVKYAWGYDELQPLTKTGTNDWYGWGVTVVDGLDTAVIMELTDVVSKMLGWIKSVDFTTTPGGDVEMFDTTIRYLGGLLSSYDLLKSGQFYNDYPADQIDALLTQAKILADKLAYGFLTPSGMSAVDVNFLTNTPVEGTYTASNGVTYNSTNTASAGSFLIEWYRLATLTGNTTYRSLVDTGEYYLVHPSPAPTYPGLVGTQFDTTAGGMLNFAGGWHSEVDSFLEYLIKSYHYQADNITKEYADFWLSAAQSTIEHIAVHPYGFDDLTFLSAMDTNGALTYSMDDYSCFAGGNFLLGCKVLGIDSLCDLGIAAADGCHQTYNTTATGLGPIYWAWYDSASNTYPPDSTVDIDNGYRRNGAANGEFIVNGNEVYASFPESVESWFYAHRITGDPRWAEYGWDMFLALNETARNSVAFATVNNVGMPWGESQSNSLDSFFFAEPEFAHPYEVLSPHCDLTIASPKGGATVLDPISVQLFKDDAYCVEFAATKQKLWTETEKLESFLGRAKEFSAILYVGGFGPMFDLVDNPKSTKLIREFYEADRIVSAVCHGSAALLNATLADGSKLIAGEKVTGFSNEEEIAVDRQKDMPFHLEDALDKASAGNYERSGAAWAPHVIVSSTKKLLTGQNPASAQGLAVELLKKLQE